MSCMKRGQTKKLKGIGELVHPHPMASQKLIQISWKTFESLCTVEIVEKIFNLGSDELKIHCNMCNEFFHCGIAGECIGEDCLIKDERGRYKHRHGTVKAVSKKSIMEKLVYVKTVVLNNVIKYHLIQIVKITSYSNLLRSYIYPS